MIQIPHKIISAKEKGAFRREYEEKIFTGSNKWSALQKFSGQDKISFDKEFHWENR